MKAPEASVVAVTGPPTFAPPPGAVSCSETEELTGQPEPVTPRLLPAGTWAAASTTTGAAVTSVVSVAVCAPTEAVTV